MPRRPRRCVHHPFSNDIDDAQLACLTLLRLPALRCLNFLIIQGFLERRRSGRRRYRCGPRERLRGYICKRNHGAIMLVDCMAVIVEHKFGPYRGPAFGSAGKTAICRPDASFAIPRPAVLLSKIALCSAVSDFSPHFRKSGVSAVMFGSRCAVSSRKKVFPSSVYALSSVA